MVQQTEVMELHAAQAAFLDRTKPLAGFVGGRGAGKTVIGAYDLIRRMKPGRRYAAIAPTYKALKDFTLLQLEEFARRFGVLKRIKKVDMIAEMTNGITVLLRSADDPDSLRGPNLSGVWMDEASLMDRDAYMVLIACLREKGELGWLSATFTPKGRQHWTYDVFSKGGDDCELFHAKTAENPFLSEAFITMLGHEYSGMRALQELGGEFVNVEGAEWPAEFFTDSIWYNTVPADVRVRVVALDPSLGTGTKWGDYSAFVMLALGADGTMYIDADMRNDRHAGELVDTSIEIQRRFNPHFFGFEVNNFQQLLATQVDDESKKQGVPMPIVTIDNRINKEVRIRRLTPFLSRGVMRFKGGSKGAQMLVDQLMSFGPKDSKLHDDGPDALEMAVRILLERSGGKPDWLGSNLMHAVGA